MRMPRVDTPDRAASRRWRRLFARGAFDEFEIARYRCAMSGRGGACALVFCHDGAPRHYGIDTFRMKGTDIAASQDGENLMLVKVIRLIMLKSDGSRVLCLRARNFDDA